jgi:hypothetical protein
VLFAKWHLETILGAVVVVTVLLDVFLTILYARIGASLFSLALARMTWSFFRAIAARFGDRRGAILSFCGPAILVSLVTFWSLALTCGAALFIEPLLGTSVLARDATPQADILTAMYVAGSSLAIVGQNEFAPRTDGARMLYLFTSFAGVSLVSLTLTYLMQVYSALRERTAVAVKVDLLADETGDAAELIARLGRDGHLAGPFVEFGELGMDITRVNVSHHFYPVLFFFRFPEAQYSVSRFSLVALDAVSPLESAIDEAAFAGIRESAALSHLWRAAVGLVTTLDDAFLPGGAPDPNDPVDATTLQCWRRRYFVALSRLQHAGIRTTADEEAGAQRYVRLRRRWGSKIAKLAPHMGYTMDEIDPASAFTDDRAPTPRRHHRPLEEI